MRVLTMLAPTLVATPALAHPGSHGHLDLPDMLTHLAGPYHVALAVAVMLVGLLAYRAGRNLEKRRAEARQTNSQNSDTENRS